MKTLAICVLLLLVIIGTMVLMRRPFDGGQELERASSSASKFDGEEKDHAVNIMPRVTQTTVLTSDVHRETIAPIASSKQNVTKKHHTKPEAPMNMPKRKGMIPVTEEDHRLVKIAFDRAIKVMEITDTSTATIEYTDDVAVVTFPFPTQAAGDHPTYPGPDYLARVKIDRNTGNVLEILGAS